MKIIHLIGQDIILKIIIEFTSLILLTVLSVFNSKETIRRLISYFFSPEIFVSNDKECFP
jgi:hypothetical protein